MAFGNKGKKIFPPWLRLCISQNRKQNYQSSAKRHRWGTYCRGVYSFGHTDYSTIVNKIKTAKPDVVFNTLNGDSNVAFFKQLKDAGITSEDITVCSVSVAEEEIRGIGAENIKGHLVSWNYYQTTDTRKTKSLWKSTNLNTEATGLPMIHRSGIYSSSFVG